MALESAIAKRAEQPQDASPVVRDTQSQSQTLSESKEFRVPFSPAGKLGSA